MGWDAHSKRDRLGPGFCRGGVVIFASLVFSPNRNPMNCNLISVNNFVRWFIKNYLALLLGTLPSAWGQSIAASNEKRIACEYNPLPKHAWTGANYRKAIDSVLNQMTGVWELVEISNGGWSRPHPPFRRTQLVFDEQGNGVALEAGQPVMKCRINLEIRYGSIWFEMDEGTRPYFRFKLPRRGNSFRNGLRVCSEALEMFGNTSAGPGYLFKRLTDK